MVGYAPLPKSERAEREGAPPGTPLRPLADAEVKAKFDACLAVQPAAVGEAQAARLRARIPSLTGWS